MSLVLTAPSRFPAGTSVAAHIRSHWPTVPERPAGAPTGAAAESATVQANRTLTFTTLAAGTQYYLYAQVGGRDYVVGISTGGVSGPQPAFESGFADGEAAVWNAANEQFEPGSAGASTTVATDTIWDAKGDLAVGSAADTAIRKPVGTNGQALTAQSGQTGGVQWATLPTLATDTLWDTKGDIAAATAADTAAKVAVGANDTVLHADSAATPGVAWKTSHTLLKSKLWRPTAISGTAQSAIIDENFSRSDFIGTASAITSTGVLRLFGGSVIPAGKTCAKAIVFLVGAGSGLTHNWAVLTDQSGAILAITADDTSATTSATAFKTYTWTTPYVASADIAVYVGICFVGSGGPTAPVKTAQNVGGEVPKFAMNSNSGLTDPASLGAGPVTLGANASPTWIALA